MSKSLSVRFWGVRGSIPAPLTGAQVERKIVQSISTFARSENKPSDGREESVKRWLEANVPFVERSTFGGNTTCVEVRCGDELIILDMGTGLRELGIALLPETVQRKGIQGTILQSHVHWDHIQGYPFWKQLYMPRTVFRNQFAFFGGRDWDRSLEDVLRGQMNAPVFPVDLRELEQMAMQMSFESVFDGRAIILETASGTIKITCRKLNHPQETFGYRIEFGGQSLAFTTDHEPFGGRGLPRALVELVRGVDLWITDCQYSHDEYIGTGGKVQKLGWGHSFPEYIAAVAVEAKPKRVVTTHHEPEAGDERIVELSQIVQSNCDIPTVPAYEGLTLIV